MSDIDLSLVVKEKTAGSLITNIELLEAMVSEKLLEFTPENYNGDADAAKKDRALLNASKKTLSAERIKIIKELMKPFEEFETRCKSLEKNIDAAALALDEIVKAREAEEKRVKMERIKTFWGCQNFELVTLDKVFDDRWLNKTMKDKDVFAEIEKKIGDIYAGIKTIEQFGVEVETLKPIFLETLDIGKTIEQGNRIKENRERLEREEAERKQREETAKLREAQQELAKEEVKVQRDEKQVDLAAQALGTEKNDDPEETFTCRFTGKRSALFAMRQYMIDNKITYEKLEV